MSIKVNGKIVAGRGADGKSAYQAAVDAGYAGTETDFNEALSKIDEVPTDAYTKAEADQKFATQASVTSVSGKVDNLQTVVNGQTETIEKIVDELANTMNDVNQLQTDVEGLQGDFSSFATKTEVEAVDTKADQAKQSAETANTAASQANTKATQAQNTANTVAENVTDHVIPDLNENTTNITALGEVMQNKPWNNTTNTQLTTAITDDSRVGFAHWYWYRGSTVRMNGWFFMNLSPIQSFQNPGSYEPGGFTLQVLTTNDKVAAGDTIVIMVPDCMATAFGKMQQNVTFMDRDGTSVPGNVTYQTGTTGANPRITISVTTPTSNQAPGLIVRYAPVNSEDV